MVRCHLTIVGIALLQIYASAAPSDILTVEEPNIKNEQINETKIDVPIEVNDGPKLDSQLSPEEEIKNEENATQNFRQKRFYNFYGFGVPPINPILYPTYNKRDQSADTGVYGLVDDPLLQIQRRLQDIASFVRQPIPPPPPPPAHFPFFFPVIYIPQYNCDCNFANGNPAPAATTENPQNLDPQTPKPENTTVTDRLPDLEDERQNWGIITNESDSDTEYDENEFARPISFDPIQPNRPTMRPAPPVDHGSSQDNSEAPITTTTTVRPTRNPTRRPPPTALPARPGSGQSGPYPASFAPQVPPSQPTTCDGAVLSCCHQPQVTYDCFVVQGCPDPTSYGNPCNPMVILQVVNKFQKFYGVRNGK